MTSWKPPPLTAPTPWQMFIHLTMPHMRQYLELAGLLGAIYILQTFDMVFVLTPLNPQTENLPNLIYQTRVQRRTTTGWPPRRAWSS